MGQFYNRVSFDISKLVTRSYSTSFSIAVSFLENEMRDAIYSIYGFVRFADEIVDSFDGYDKKTLLEQFEASYYEAYNNGISLNPILHSFQGVVKKYQIPDDLIQAFLKSMKADLVKNDYKSKAEIDEYIYGSADVVGLMCLKVFVNGNDELYHELHHSAMKLGSAFQKVNFLRDMKNDIEVLDRCYFPDVNRQNFNDHIKKEIVNDIQSDFNAAYIGIRKLPKDAKLPVVIAYYYYSRLLKKIKSTPAQELIGKRIRVSDSKKILLLGKAYVACKYGVV
jgi:phytoene/squalene synthetase